MKDTNSLSHTSYRCKYHIVIVPKYRRVIIYNKLRADIIQIIKMLVNKETRFKNNRGRSMSRSHTSIIGNTAEIFSIRDKGIFEIKIDTNDI